MNFTREPIIETILSPKDGYKLCVKSSKIAGAEELLVDVVEVVSFGHAFFFRGQERPKPFLVPVSDYEVFEVKETRVVLKNATHDRNIKIGGGRDAPVKPQKEAAVVEDVVVAEEPVEAASSEAKTDSKADRKRDRRRSRRKRLAEEKKEGPKESSKEEGSEDAPVEEVKVSSAMFAHLLPPPSTLISEKLNKLKEKELAKLEALAPVQEPIQEVVEKAEAESSEDSSFFS